MSMSRHSTGVPAKAAFKRAVACEICVYSGDGSHRLSAHVDVEPIRPPIDTPHILDPTQPTCSWCSGPRPCFPTISSPALTDAPRSTTWYVLFCGSSLSSSSPSSSPPAAAVIFAEGGRDGIVAVSLGVWGPSSQQERSTHPAAAPRPLPETARRSRAAPPGCRCCRSHARPRPARLYVCCGWKTKPHQPPVHPAVIQIKHAHSH